MASRLQLADLFDLELQLSRDRDAGRDELRVRDRRIGLAIDAGERLASPDRLERQAVLRDWLAALRKQEGADSAGERFVRAYRLVGWVLTLVGLSSGVGAAAAVLSYDGTRPVNVVHFLAVFVALQIVLVTLFVFSATLWRLRDRIPVVEGVYGLLRLAFEAAARLFERRLSAERRGALAAARGRLRASRLVYGEAERWLLVTLAQRFGLWFNLGALATCLYLIAFSDLAFAWQTTLSWSAEGLHRVMSLLAAPWSWAYPDGLPGIEVVRASRYFRLDGSFGAPAAHPQLLGQWWRFLVLALATYGLVPRVVLSLLSARKLRRALAGLRLDHADVASLLERLASPIVRTRAPVPESGPLEAPGGAPAAPAAAAASADSARVVIWGGFPIEPAEVDALVARRFGWQVGSIEQAGADDTGRDAAAIEALAGARGGRQAVLLLAEAFESPTREARTFVQRLRQALGADRSLVVGLVDRDAAGRWCSPGGDDLRIWQKHLAALGDPYLRVESLVET